MESPNQWQSGVLEQDVLPSTSAFVAPGQEELFFVQGQCFDSSPGTRRTGNVPASPIQLQSVPPVLLPHGSYLGMPSYLISQEPLMQTTSSPASRAQPFQHVYQVVPAVGYQNQHAHLAAVDLAAATHSPSRDEPQSLLSRMYPSPSALTHGLEPGIHMYDSIQHAQLNYAAVSQYGSQNQQRPQLLGQHPSVQALGPRFAAAAGAGHGGDGSGVVHPYGLAGPGSIVSSYPHQQQQQQQQQQSTSPSTQQPQQAFPLRASISTSDQYGQAVGSPARLHPQQQQHPGSLGSNVHQATSLPGPFDISIPGPTVELRAGAQSANEQPPRVGVTREGLPGCAGLCPDAMGPPPASPVAARKAASGANLMGSLQSATVTVGGVVGGLHGGVRHVVEELRTSPLISPSDYETPGHGGIGGPRSTGVAVQGGGGSSGEKNTVIQRYQAQILSLERQNTELHKRLTDAQTALEAARQARQALEAKQDDMVDQVAQANHSAKSRESALESARRANDALSGELRSCQEELATVRNALATAKDTAVQWQDRTMEVGKELEAARKKIDTLGEEERRLSSENMALRKEVQQLNDVIIKGRIESAELREKLRSAQQETARAASTAQALASRAESEQEGAAIQISLMRNKVVDLESRNSQLLYDVAGLREEATRARQAADAVKAALASKPAGISTDGGLSTRQKHPHGVMTTGWAPHELQPTGSGRVPGGGSVYGTYSGKGYGTTYGDGIGAGAGAGYGNVAYGDGDGGSIGTVSGSGGGTSGRPSLMPPVPLPTSVLSPSQSDPSMTAAAILRDLPSDVAFSKLDPETFRSMVRAEAEAMARGGGGGGGGMYGAANSPLKPSYATKYGGPGGDLSLEPEPSIVGNGMPSLPPPSLRMAWGEGPGRDLSAAALPPPPPPPSTDAQSMWRLSAASLVEEKSFGAGVGVGATSNASAGAGNNRAGGRVVPPPSGGNGRGSPPPYAVNVVESSYAYRRPANAVGAGVMPASGGGGSGTPFGTEETVKDMMARSKALEDQLMVLCSEKGGLEAEYARMPLGAGRSLRERNRKQVVEQRLELLNKEISSVRMQLKRLGVK